MSRRDGENQNEHPRIVGLRRVAEDRVENLYDNVLPPGTPEEIIEMFHELQVHQIELEMQNEELSNLYEELDEMKNRYFNLYDMAPVGYAVVNRDNCIIETNLTLSTLLGVSRSNIIGKKFSNFIHNDDKDIFYIHQKSLSKRGELQTYEIRLKKTPSASLYVEIHAMKDLQGNDSSRLVVSDITARKEAEISSLQNLQRFRIAQEMSPDGFSILRPIRDEADGIIDFLYVYENDAASYFNNRKNEDAVGERLLELSPLFRNAPLMSAYIKVAQSGRSITLESELIGTGLTEPLWLRYAIVPMGEDIAILTQDLSERRRNQEQLLYEHEHDFLTGLYNRGFLEKEQKRLLNQSFLPVSIIIADTNGLKLINDSFGHALGDEVLKKSAQLLRKYCGPHDIVVRYGGDEFVILLPNTTIEETALLVKKIIAASHKVQVELIQLSLAFGYDTRYSTEDDFETIFKKAEDMMYRNKLYQSSSAKSKTINLVMNSLFAKSNQESRHSIRVSKLCEFIATKLGMSHLEISRMRVAGLMHDIGKIGIPESILNKKGSIGEKEWTLVKRHPEIGSRILAASDEFVDISEAILEHHERWDGKGYPRGIEGENISLQARIINVADAFDAMTSVRSYKRSMSNQEAIDEIIHCSNAQFDPHIAHVFVTHYREFIKER